MALDRIVTKIDRNEIRVSLNRCDILGRCYRVMCQSQSFKFMKIL